MTSRGKPVRTQLAASVEEERARATLALAETVEDPRRVNIRSLGKDPDVQPPSQLVEQIPDLFGQGQKPERKSILTTHALIYLLGPRAESRELRDRVMAARTGQVAAMVGYLSSRWESELRPKTWVDALSLEQQSEWAVLKRQYSNQIQASIERVNKAKAAYQRALEEERLSQATEREKLISKLKEWNVGVSEVFKEPKAPEAQLQAELRELGFGEGEAGELFFPGSFSQA